MIRATRNQVDRVIVIHPGEGRVRPQFRNRIRQGIALVSLTCTFNRGAARGCLKIKTINEGALILDAKRTKIRIDVIAYIDINSIGLSF